jgi:hypothetical protein
MSHEELVLDCPRTLNFYWMWAHMLGWCPYELKDCREVDSVFVSSLKLLVPGSADPEYLDPVQEVWQRQVLRRREGVQKAQLGNMDLELLELLEWPRSFRVMAEALWTLFLNMWQGPFGIRAAMQYWQDSFMGLLQYGDHQSRLRELQTRSSFWWIDVVGTEDVLRISDVWVLGGVEAIQSPQHLLALGLNVF